MVEDVDLVFQCGQSIAAKREDQPSTLASWKAEGVTIVKVSLTYLLKNVRNEGWTRG